MAETFSHFQNFKKIRDYIKELFKDYEVLFRHTTKKIEKC